MKQSCIGSNIIGSLPTWCPEHGPDDFDQCRANIFLRNSHGANARRRVEHCFIMLYLSPSQKSLTFRPTRWLRQDKSFYPGGLCRSISTRTLRSMPTTCFIAQTKFTVFEGPAFLGWDGLGFMLGEPLAQYAIAAWLWASSPSFSPPQMAPRRKDLLQEHHYSFQFWMHTLGSRFQKKEHVRAKSAHV